MSQIWKITLFTSVLFFIYSVSSSAHLKTPEELNDELKDESSDSKEKETSEKELGTVSTSEMEKLKKEIIENQAENNEKFGLALTSSPEEVATFLKKEEEEFGTELPEKIEDELTDTDDFKSFVHFLALFDKIEAESSENDEDENIEKSPAEMKEMKAEVFKLINELNKRQGLLEVSHEKFDEVWNAKKAEYGKKFPGKVVKLIRLLEEPKESTTPLREVSDVSTEASTQTAEVPKEPPKDAFVLRNSKGKVCILAKFNSSITITYPGKTSEQKVEVSIPTSGHTKGRCGGPNRSPSLQISWGNFDFSLLFNKTSEEFWSVALVELAFDTSDPLLDGAANRGKVTAKSEKVSLFETPFGKSYFCPAQEVILLYSENQHVATVHLKELHLQPYDVEDGIFSPIHRCNQVVIGGPDEEPFVQDETVPLAVGCTLALITLLILVGFSVHRAYNAAKVDYNTVE